MASLNVTINDNTNQNIDLNKFYDKFKLDSLFNVKCLNYKNIIKTDIEHHFRKTEKGKEIESKIKKNCFKNTLSLSYDIDERTIPIKIFDTGKISLTKISDKHLAIVKKDLKKKINATGFNFELKGQSVKSMTYYLKISDGDVDLNYLNTHLKDKNIREYFYFRNNRVPFIKLKYEWNGYKSTIQIRSAGKVQIDLSIKDTLKINTIPYNETLTVNEYVTSLVKILLKNQNNKKGLLDYGCRDGSVYVRDKKGKLKCKKITKKDCENFFIGTDEYKGFNNYEKSDIEEAMNFIKLPIQTNNTMFKDRNPFLNKIKNPCIHLPILKENMKNIKRDEWLIYAIPEGRNERLRFLIDGQGESFYIDNDNRFVKSNYPRLPHTFNIIMDGYYNFDNEEYSPIDLIMIEAEEIYKLKYAKRMKKMEQIAQKYNMDYKIVNMNDFSKIELNTTSGLVFIKKNGLYDDTNNDYKYSWKEIDNTLVTYMGGNTINAGSFLDVIDYNLGNYKKGSILLIVFENQQIKVKSQLNYINVNDLNKNIYDSKLSFVELNSLIYQSFKEMKKSSIEELLLNN